MIKNLIKKIKHRFNKNKIKYLIWDFDGTLYQNPKVGQAIKKQYLLYLKKNGFNLSEKSFDLLTKKFNSWGEMTSILLNKPETEILEKTNQSFNIETYLKKDPQIINLVKNFSSFNHVILSNSIFLNNHLSFL